MQARGTKVSFLGTYDKQSLTNTAYKIDCNTKRSKESGRVATMEAITLGNMTLFANKGVDKTPKDFPKRGYGLEYSTKKKAGREGEDSKFDEEWS
ncbi:hypothetical protein Tco_1005152 [Tanacetum coccineum]|uniref:Uncharacterized protein n=1 Tax=Tanacetum coccineum TaxID=301880 RepID=A0ABQ5FEN2_9ASTR